MKRVTPGFISPITITIMYEGRSIDTLMQIPRGTFRALKRRCNPLTLIEELRDSAFSGYCKMAFGSGSITLVFENGNIQLAQYDALYGDAALERILRSDLVTVDAVLHDLSPAQLDLAREFNPISIVKNEKGAISTEQQGSNALSGNNFGTLKDPRKTSLTKKLKNHESQTVQEDPHNIPEEKPLIKSEIPDVLENDDETSLLARELDAMDAIDIESMTAKFRANYRLMMERLELEHLIDHTTGKDPP